MWVLRAFSRALIRKPCGRCERTANEFLQKNPGDWHWSEKRGKSMAKPIVVIRNLEDSPDWLDQRLIAAYLNSKYWTEAIQLNDSGVFFEIGQPALALESQLQEHGVRSFAFITAWNPASRMLDQWHNQWRNLQLEFELHARCRLLRRGMGIGHEDDWAPEESFLCVDISPERAVEAGRQFGQNAIVYWQEGGVPELWWIAGGTD